MYAVGDAKCGLMEAADAKRFSKEERALTYDCSQWGVDSDTLGFKTLVWITHYTVWICFSRQSEPCRVCGRERGRSVGGRERPAVHEGNSYSWQWVSVIILACRLGFSIHLISLAFCRLYLKAAVTYWPRQKKGDPNLNLLSTSGAEKTPRILILATWLQKGH